METELGWHRRGREAIVVRVARSLPPAGKTDWSTASGDLQGCAWRGRYGNMDGEIGPFRSRRIGMTIWNSQGTVAAASFTEWRCDDPFADMDDFVYWADADSQYAHEFSVAISKQWEYDPPFEFGSMAVFDRLVIASRLDSSRQVWPMLRKMIDREFRRRASALFLKAFPLEFEGKAGSIDYDQMFRRRQRAMVAHYRRQLGVEPIPGHGGKEGWLWRPIRYCPLPTDHLGELVS